VADFLIKQSIHAPLELAQALHIPPGQGFPLLLGGHPTPLERRCRQLLTQAAGARQAAGDDAVTHVFTCRPLSKLAALNRGALGGDCSSQSVPFRCLSPHHVYYGVFQGEMQQRGYMTVFEAWGEVETGERIPVLCLETINAPLKSFDSVQNDLTVIFDAIAEQQGLFPRVVLLTQRGTWNYHNGEVLRQCRRFRQGTPVDLFPADPICWGIYRALAAEARSYSCFEPTYEVAPFRILAPFDPRLDRINPANLVEAERIRSLPRSQQEVTIRTDKDAAGYISQLPAL
jgi:hypothetical protein